MNGTGRQITIYEFERIGRIERERLTLEGLAKQTGLHPTLIEQFVEYGLIEPAERMGAQSRFDIDCVVRVRKIERLRHDLGANLASVAVILDLLDRMSRLEKEVERLQRLAP
jgi:DNA-binding transcriptional MerR regulator